MEPDETDVVVQQIMDVLDGEFQKEKIARLQASALENGQYALSTTYEMAQDMEREIAIEDLLTRYGFEQYSVEDDAELWISEEYGLMIFLYFTDADGRYYEYRIVAFDILGEAVEET
jgi:hypothetical protein